MFKNYSNFYIFFFVFCINSIMGACSSKEMIKTTSASIYTLTSKPPSSYEYECDPKYLAIPRQVPISLSLAPDSLAPDTVEYYL